MSCATTTLCVAVDDNGDALTYDGSTWSAPTGIDGGHALTSVSCPTANFCAAVDSAGNAVDLPAPHRDHDRIAPGGNGAPPLLGHPGGDAGAIPPTSGWPTLPRGLRIDRSTGVISARPVRPGTFPVTVTLHDQKIRITHRPATQNRAFKSYMLTIS